LDIHPDEQQASAAPARLVQVEMRKYVELLVSRRRLERVLEKADQLHDLETDETFVLDAESVAWMAKGA
jgi:hypothetical protein